MAKPPHLPALAPEYEREPAHKMPEWFQPLNGIQYKVQDGDSLAGIARNGRIPPDTLLQYSFGTTDPREVNWHLRNRVGCKVYAPKVQGVNKNFSFSTSADPGLIWLPDFVYRRITAKPKPAAHKYSTPGNIPRYYQKSGNVCWGAAVANIYDWKKRVPRRTATRALAEIGWTWAALYTAGNYIQGPQFKELASDAGLKPFPIGDFRDDQAWMDTIRWRGPLLILQKAYGTWTHWIVISGYEYDSSGRLWINYVDVADGLKYTESADAIYENSLDALTQIPRVWGY
jgi:Papain-like cysteine protease AvrRpt2